MNNPTLFDPIEPDIPVLPYGGTSGWSGSDTSRERADKADQDGTTTARQNHALTALHHAGVRGLTWFELAETLNLHHGSASGVLSVLHKVGAIDRLTERRGRCAVYTHPTYTADRETAPYTPSKANRLLVEILTELADDLNSGRTTLAKQRINATLNILK